MAPAASEIRVVVTVPDHWMLLPTAGYLRDEAEQRSEERAPAVEELLPDLVRLAGVAEGVGIEVCAMGSVVVDGALVGASLTLAQIADPPLTLLGDRVDELIDEDAASEVSTHSVELDGVGPAVRVSWRPVVTEDGDRGVAAEYFFPHPATGAAVVVACSASGPADPEQLFDLVDTLASQVHYVTV